MRPDAKEHYDRGLALYAEKNYTAALTELRAGHALDPRREFLFAEAQTLRLGGDCKNAVPLYQQFLKSGPDDVQVNATHIALGRCAAQMAAAAPPQGTDKTRAGSTPLVIAPVRPPAPAPWYYDVPGGALLGGGVLALGTGAILSIAVMSARDDANQHATTYDQYNQRWDSARTRQRLAIVAWATGGFLTSAAIVRYALVRARDHTHAWVAPTEHGAIAGVGGRF
jgi:hypothetical protein